MKQMQTILNIFQSRIPMTSMKSSKSFEQVAKSPKNLPGFRYVEFVPILLNPSSGKSKSQHLVRI
jgi:hypothetical protein